MNSVIIEQKLYFKYFPHFVLIWNEWLFEYTCHYIGLDNNDTPSISANTPLVPGVSFCIEPGIYVSQRKVNDWLISLMEVKKYLKNCVILVYVLKIHYYMLIPRVLIF